MKKVYQTIYGEEKGNCFAACVASILELNIEQVPDFLGEYGDRWMYGLNEWLEQFGLAAITVAFQDDDPHIKKGYACAGIRTPTGSKHSVVYKDLKFVWNPQKGWEDYDAEPEDYTFFVVLDPAKYMEFIEKEKYPLMSIGVKTNKLSDDEIARLQHYERNKDTKYKIVSELDENTCEFCKQYNGFIVIGSTTLNKQMEIIQNNCTSESKCRCRVEKIEMYICPECRDLNYTNTTNGRRGFADTPGKCLRHPEVEMIKKEI